MEDNLKKQNATFLGDFKENEKDVRTLEDCTNCGGCGHWISESGDQVLCFECSGSGKHIPINYFIGTETGIEDIETPPSDN